MGVRLGVVLIGASLSACAAPPARPAALVVVQRPAAETVFLARPIVERPATSSATGHTPELFRRDEALGDRPSVALTANDRWPERPRPDGERLYRFRPSRTAHSLSFFRGPASAPYASPYGDPYSGDGYRRPRGSYFHSIRPR